MDKARNMTNGHPLKLLLESFYPLALGHVLQQLYSIADGAVVGRLIGYQAFAAVGAAELPRWLVLSIVLGITQGFGVMFSRTYRAGDKSNLRKTIAMAVVLCAIIGGLFTASAFWLSRPLLRLLHTPADIFEDTASYLTVIVGGIAITITYNLLAAILRALGNSKTPVTAVIMSSIVNIVLDIIAITVFDMGVTVVALTTLIAQLLACAYCFGVLSSTDFIAPRKADWKIDRRAIQGLLRYGTPLAVRNAVIGVAGLVIQFVINSFGTLFVCGVAVAKKFLGALEIVGEALETAVVSYVEQNYEAKKFDRVRQGVGYAVRIALVSSILLALTMSALGKQLVLLLISGNGSEIHHVLHTGYEHLVIIGLGLPALYLMFVWRAALHGIGNVSIPTLSGFVELGLRVAAILLLPLLMGELGVAYGECAGWIGAAILTGMVYAQTRKRLPVSEQTS